VRVHFPPQLVVSPQALIGRYGAGNLCAPIEDAAIETGGAGDHRPSGWANYGENI
jgi:hypothetical protein